MDYGDTLASTALQEVPASPKRVEEKKKAKGAAKMYKSGWM